MLRPAASRTGERGLRPARQRPSLLLLLRLHAGDLLQRVARGLLQRLVLLFALRDALQRLDDFLVVLLGDRAQRGGGLEADVVVAEVLALVLRLGDVLAGQHLGQRRQGAAGLLAHAAEAQ